MYPLFFHFGYDNKEIKIKCLSTSVPGQALL